MEDNKEKPELVATCITESFGAEIPDDNRLTKEDIEKHILPNKKQEIDTANLPFKLEDNHTGLDKKFPMYISKVLEAYESGRYKEFRNILKKQKRKEEKQKNSPMPQVVRGSKLENGNFKITFE